MPHDDDTTQPAADTPATTRPMRRGGAHSARKSASRTQRTGEQAQPRARGAHSRPAGAHGTRRPPRAAIIGACAALVVIIAIVVGVVLLTGGHSDEANMLAAADAAMDAVVSPDDDEREAMAGEISETMEDAGLSFEDMGIEMQDFATWMYADAGYERVDYELDGTTASVTYSVTANKVDTLLTSVSQSIESMDYDGIESMSEAYAKVGEIMTGLMDESEPTSKDITLTLTCADEQWSVDSAESDLVYEVFFE